MIQVASTGTFKRRRGISVSSSAAAAGVTTFRDAVLADSPVSYWRMQETSGTNAADVQAANAGTYVGAPTLAQASPISDTGAKSVAFSGAAAQRVDVATSASLDFLAAFTLEAWVNPTDRLGFYYIITKDASNVAAPYEWRLEGTTGIPNLLIGGGTSNSATAAPTAGVFSHLAVTVTAGNVWTHYLNGAANGTGTFAGTRAGTSGTAMRIGTRDDLTSGFKGSLAEPVVYNTALSGARILAHWNAR